METSRISFVVRQVILNWRCDISALHVEFGMEHAFGEQVGVYTANSVAWDFSEEIDAAALALSARRGLEGEGLDFSSGYGDSGGWKQSAWKSFAMNRLAIIAIAEELSHRLTGELQLNGTARTLNISDHQGSL